MQLDLPFLRAAPPAAPAIDFIRVRRARKYILRVQANDASGEGGGGFQCCWTNTHVRVTVK